MKYKKRHAMGKTKKKGMDTETPTADMRLRRISILIVPVLKNHDVSRAAIFGSYARGEAKRTSDIDLLIRFKGRKSLLDLAALEIELETKLGRKFDVLTYDSLNPLIRKSILGEEVRII